jgi:FAD/FMN-containing dehydrogenase
MIRRLRCTLFAVSLGGLAPVLHVACWSSRSEPTPQPVVLDDASHMDSTCVREVARPRTEDEIRGAVASARARGLHVAIAGKRHSMGGQCLCRDALLLDMTAFDRVLAFDEAQRVVTVQSGITWCDLQSFLNPRGLAILVMQGPNVFTVGGSISVNAHGWDIRHGTVSQGVEWFRVLCADGSVRRCSRSENAELFHLVIGGYGLFGVILDVGLRVTENSAYRPSTFACDGGGLAHAFDVHALSDARVDLAEADLSIAPSSLLDEAIGVAYARVPGRAACTDALAEEQHATRDRFFIDLSRRSNAGKELRWRLQKRLEYPSATAVCTRNNVFRSPMGRLRHESDRDTDVLQEYFVPRDELAPFLVRLRAIVRERRINLLSATVRYVRSNDDAFLNYTRRDAYALVLYVNVKTSTQGRADSSRATRALVDAALESGGTFYLPYVLAYDGDELRRGYPEIDAFFAAKRKLDPSELFMNELYAKYAR